MARGMHIAERPRSVQTRCSVLKIHRAGQGRLVHTNQCGVINMSQLIPWLPQYEVHVSDVDHQHRELFRMLNELLDSTWDGKGQDFIIHALEFLAQYAVNHFATEEEYMMKYSYPGYKEHKKAHDDFTAQVIDFIKDYDAKGINTTLLVTVILELGNWTKDHIRDKDQELGRFICANVEHGPKESTLRLRKVG
jgi:hemerythrin